MDYDESELESKKCRWHRSFYNNMPFLSSGHLLHNTFMGALARIPAERAGHIEKLLDKERQKRLL
jgi:hypothetical protein